MDLDSSEKWQRLVDAFGLKKSGASSWDAKQLDQHFLGASHGEKCTMKFLLNLWNSSDEWQCGKFDLFDAMSTWGEKQQRAFRSWAADPWWP